MGMAVGIYFSRVYRNRVARGMGSPLRKTGETRQGKAAGANPTSDEPVIEAAIPMAPVVPLPADLVVHRCEIPDRPHLVVLSYLDAGLLKSRHLDLKNELASSRDHLHDRDRAEHRGRLADRLSGFARMERNARPKNGAPDFRRVCRSGSLATTGGVWSAVALIGLAGAAHQAWSANLYTSVSDMLPKSAVASVIGIGSTAGSLGGMIFPIVTGWLLDHFSAIGQINSGYRLLFFWCSRLLHRGLRVQPSAGTEVHASRIK